MSFKHYSQISKEDIPSMNIKNVNAFLRDFSISDDKEKPMTSGLFRLKAGESLKYTYTYHEMKFIVEGNFTIEDETGQKVEAKPGFILFSKRNCCYFYNIKFWIRFLLWTTWRR